jgi:uncharacterized membrane protein
MYSLSTGFLSIFAFSGFVYIIVLATLMLRGMSVPRWAFVLLFIIGVLGLVLDGIMVYLYLFVKFPI